MSEHNGEGSRSQSARGANYTRARRPVALVYHEQHSNRSEASRREWQLKRLPRPAKQGLIASQTSI